MCQLKNIFTTLINAFVFVGCLSVVVILTPELEAKTNFVNNDSLRTKNRKAEIADVKFFSKLKTKKQTKKQMTYCFLCIVQNAETNGLIIRFKLQSEVTH